LPIDWTLSGILEDVEQLERLGDLAKGGRDHDEATVYAGSDLGASSERETVQPARAKRIEVSKKGMVVVWQRNRAWDMVNLQLQPPYVASRTDLLGADL
jgi:hypothetical protein